MPTVGPNYVGTSTAVSGTWASPTNAVGSGTGTYTTWSHSARRDSGTWQGSAFFASGAVPSNATLTSITYAIRHKESSTNVTAQAQLLKSGTVVDGPNALTNSTADATATFTVNPATAGIAVADLPNLQVQLIATGATNTNAATESIDYATISVTYTVPTITPPTDSYSAAIEADNPIAYYRMDDSGASVLDWMTGVNNGTIIGGVTTGATGAISGDAAMAFDGSTGYITVPNFPSLGSTYTYEAWVKAPSAALPQQLINDPTNVLSLYLYSGSLSFQAGATTVNTTYPTDGGWHHVVGTYDGSKVNVYLDTVLTSVAAAGSAATAGTLFLARPESASAANYLAGSLDEVALYSYALTPAKVAAHFSAASGTTGTSLSVANAVHTQATPNLSFADPADAHVGAGVVGQFYVGGTAVTTLSVANASHAEAASAVGLTKQSVLAVANAAHAAAAVNVDITKQSTLAVDSAAHVEASGQATLTQVHNLTVQDATHTQAADSVNLSGVPALAIANAAQAQAASSPALGQIHQLAVQGAAHSESVQQLTIGVAYTLTIQGSSHASSANSLTLTGTGALGVAGASHGQVVTSLALIQVHNLTIATADHSQQVDSLSLFIGLPGPPITGPGPSQITLVTSGKMVAATNSGRTMAQVATGATSVTNIPTGKSTIQVGTSLTSLVIPTGLTSQQVESTGETEATDIPSGKKEVVVG